MREYFEPQSGLLTEAPGRDLPITVTKETWTRNDNPESLRKLFRFKSSISMLSFIEDVVQMQDEVGHYGKLLVEKNAVLAHVSTTALERVTDLDVEWAAQVDQIYDDVKSTEL